MKNENVSIQSKVTNASFVKECTKTFLSEKILQNQKISSLDVARFYNLLCHINDIEKCSRSNNSQLQFNALNIYIQLEFIRFICPFTLEQNSSYNRKACIEEQRRLGGYGVLILSNLTLSQVNGKIQDLCSNLLKYSSYYLYQGTMIDSIPSVAPSDAVLSSNTPTMMSSTEPSTTTPVDYLEHPPSQSPVKSPNKLTTEPSPETTASSSYDQMKNYVETKVTFTYIIEFFDKKDQKAIYEGQDISNEILHSASSSLLAILSQTRRGGVSLSVEDGHLMKYRFSGQQQQETLHSDYQRRRRLDMTIVPFDNIEELIVNTVFLNPFCITDIQLFDSNQNDPSLSSSLRLDPSKDGSRMDQYGRKSSFCVFVVSEINVKTKAEEYTQGEIESYVLIPIKISMIGSKFKDSLGFNDVIKAVKYFGDGSSIFFEPSQRPSSMPTSESIDNSNDPIIQQINFHSMSGWVVAAAVTSLAIIFQIRNRRKIQKEKYRNELRNIAKRRNETGSANRSGGSIND